jgi:hypothetical protein
VFPVDVRQDEHRDDDDDGDGDVDDDDVNVDDERSDKRSKRRAFDDDDDDDVEGQDEAAFTASFAPFAHWLTQAPRSCATEICDAIEAGSSAEQQRALRVLCLSGGDDVELGARARVWWIATSVDWFVASGRISSPSERYRTRALAVLLLELFYRFVWAQYTAQLFIVASASAAAEPESAVEPAEPSVYAQEAVIDVDVHDDDEDDEEDDDDEDDEEEAEDDDEDELIADGYASAGSEELAEASTETEAVDMQWASQLARNAADGGGVATPLPHVVNLFFSQPQLSSAIDVCEERLFADVSAAVDDVWSLAFDVTDALNALALLVATREFVTGDDALAAVADDLRSAYESIYVPWLADLGLESDTDAGGRTRWKWRDDMRTYARCIYASSFINLTQGGTVSRSTDFCELFGELLLAADSRADTSLVSATLLIETALASNGQFDAEVGRLMGLLDQLTSERERWRASLAAPYDRAPERSAPAPLQASTVIRDRLQSGAEQRLAELDAMIRSVQDELHERTAHFDAVASAPRRAPRVARTVLERILARRSGDDAWASDMHAFAATLAPGALSVSATWHSLHGAWLSWLLCDVGRALLVSLSVAFRGPSAVFWSAGGGGDTTEAALPEVLSGALRTTLRLLKTAVPEQPYATSADGAVALPSVDELVDALANKLAKTPLSAAERSCALEPGGALHLLRDAVQHWVDSDLAPQLHTHMRAVQVHRAECTDRRRKPPALQLAINAQAALSVALAVSCLHRISQFRGALTFGRSLSSGDGTGALFATSAHELYGAMWSDERRVISTANVGALDALQFAPLHCDKRCNARVLFDSVTESARLLVVGRLDPLRFALGEGEQWDVFQDSLRIQPLAVVDVMADATQQFAAFVSCDGRLPSPLLLTQHALRGAAPFVAATTTVQLFQCAPSAWRSPPSAIHACVVGDRSSPVWMASGAHLHCVAMAADGGAIGAAALVQLKLALTTVTLDDVASRWQCDDDSVVVAMVSRTTSSCVLFGSAAALKAHVRVLGGTAVAGARFVARTNPVLLVRGDAARAVDDAKLAALGELVARAQLAGAYVTPLVLASSASCEQLRVRVQYETLVARKWSPRTSTRCLLDGWLETTGSAVLVFAPSETPTA